MLWEGVIKPSTSTWSSPVVLIKKNTGNYLFCIDMRCVNDSSIKNTYPLLSFKFVTIFSTEIR